MIIEETENGDLKFGTNNFDGLNKGIVIFPENLSDIKKLEQIKLFLENILKKD